MFVSKTAPTRTVQPQSPEAAASLDLSSFRPVEAGGVIGDNPPPYVEGVLENGKHWIITALPDELMISAPRVFPRDMSDAELSSADAALTKFLAGNEPLENRDVVEYVEKAIRSARGETAATSTAMTRDTFG